MKFKTRKTWRNDGGNQEAHPLRQYRPSTIDEIKAVIREAKRNKVQARAVGSGHSWSDVALTTGFMILPDKLTRVLDLETEVLKPEAKARHLFRVESGITIRKLNKVLERKNLALRNMGGYDGQTIVGAISTSTHGSGLRFGPMSDSVISLDLVAEDERIYRIEPEDGVTDATVFGEKYSDRVLIQDDEWFNSAVVSMGCFGVIYSVILDVRDKFWLKEVRTLRSWSEVKTDLAKRLVFKQNDRYEVLLNPYQNDDGDHSCLITTRNEIEKPKGHLAFDKTNRDFFTELLASLPLVRKLLRWLFGVKPKIAPESIEAALRRLQDDAYINVSYKVMNIGKANDVEAISAEIALPMADDLYLEAVDAFLSTVEQQRLLGRLYLTSPVSLRFVEASTSYASMMHNRDTCMLEIISLKDTYGFEEMVAEYEKEFYTFGGRPHWGQLNFLTGSHNFIKNAYPEFKRWLKVYNTINPDGTFAAPFTKRLGISSEPFKSERHPNSALKEESQDAETAVKP